MKRLIFCLSSLLLWLSVIPILAACRLLPIGNSTPIPPIVTEAPPAAAYESLTAVTTAVVPARDMADLFARFQGIEAPRVAQTQPSNYQVGDLASFWIKNLGNSQNELIEATLIYRSDTLNMWLQAGEQVNVAEVEEAAQRLESQILPTTRAFFGQEWQPGVDGDPRINILHLGHIRGVGGAYFSSADEYVTAVNPYSNQREMLYVSLKEAPVGSETYYRTIAHEMQHLIQWHIDKNEDAWFNEGLAELAAHINGFRPNRAGDYVNQTGIQLNTLSQEREVIAAHYAAAYLFSVYFFDRFGAEATKTLARHPENGIASFAQVLEELNSGLRFDDLFADWLATNYLAGVERGEGVYQYSNLAMPPMKPVEIGRFPASDTAAVNQFGADFIHWRSDEPLTVIFTGTQQVNLVSAPPHSGDYFWLSYPADESDMSLTRRFDLSLLDTATLTFWTWYEIEAGWDYGYVTVSVDGGRTWQLLETKSTTRDNPQGNSFGPGFTGVSGSDNGREAAPVWVQETADLTPYTGRPIWLRFQYVTDGAVNKQGFVIDDIAIPELNYLDDAESGVGGWEAAGFVHSANVLPQSFIVQGILISDDDVQIQRLLLDKNQQGQWQFPMDKEYNEAILIVAGSTPVTRQIAAYAYEIHK